MSELDLNNIVGFKAVDAEGNEQQVTVDEMVNMVSAKMVMALSETSTFAAAAAAGTDEFEDQLPVSDTFSWLRTLDGSKNPTLTSSTAAAKVLGELIGVTTPTKDGLMPKNQVCRNIGKNDNSYCCLKFEIKSFGEWVNGFLYVADTNGVTSTIAVSATIWNTTRVYCKLINGGNEYIQSISYKKEADSMLIFIKISQYANILFAPMSKYYGSSLETVSSIPSDAINVNFLT